VGDLLPDHRPLHALPPLFPGLPRKLELDASSVDEVIHQLDERWPGYTQLEPRSRVDVIAAISCG
jgi:hypothetical protein